MTRKDTKGAKTQSRFRLIMFYFGFTLLSSDQCYSEQYNASHASSDLRQCFNISIDTLPVPKEYQSIPVSKKNTVEVDSISVTRLAVVSGLGLVAITASQLLQAEKHWKQSTSFHFNFHDDWNYAKSADKFGHALAGYSLTRTFEDALRWSGVDSSTSLWMASGLAFTHQSIVELRDGFSKGEPSEQFPYLGFSWGDVSANLIGSALPILQSYLAEPNSITLKYSVHASDKVDRGFYSSVLDDYESEYHWLSISPRLFLPRSSQSSFPSWLNFAIGHSVRDIVSSPGVFSNSGRHVWWLALDINLENIIHVESKEMRWLLRTLNLYHLPMPSVQLYPNVVWYGLRW